MQALLSTVALALLATSCGSSAVFRGDTAQARRAGTNAEHFGADGGNSQTAHHTPAQGSAAALPAGHANDAIAINDASGGDVGSAGSPPPASDGSGSKRGLPGADAGTGGGELEPAVGSEGNMPNGAFRIPVAFYCSQETTENIMSTTLTATGVTYKLYDLRGNLVTEDVDVNRAALRRQSIIDRKAAELQMAIPLTGEFYAAFCNIAEHTGCYVEPDLRADALNQGDGESLTGVLGVIGMIKIQGGKLVSASKGQSLFDRPTTEAEKKACDKVMSPLVVDLAGMGFSFSGPSQGVRFDLNADGIPEVASWPATADNALLAVDWNDNGKIDNGQELFGNYTVGPDSLVSSNGFLSLAKHDYNRDGRISILDPVYPRLRLWRDANVDG